MEYYKELFFIKKKHSYDLKEINFHISDCDNIVKYDNVPSSGFKLVNSNLLDPITGYIFYPTNYIAFKEILINRNLLLNGVCTKPLIFEYILGGSFKAHIYDDVKDNLEEVEMSVKVSLSENIPGSILRNIEDESYYIYLGLVGQYYVSTMGNKSVKKKHLVLKTKFVNSIDEETVLSVQHFSYVDYTRDTEKKYVVIKNTDVDKLKIQCHYFGRETIHLGNYINNDIFDIYKFQIDYPTLMLSKTIKKVFSKQDISLTRNNVNISYDYIGETSLDVVYKLDYGRYDKNNSFFNVNLHSSIISQNKDIEIDFEKNNYAVEIQGDMFLLSERILYEFECYSSYFENAIDTFIGDINTVLYFYKADRYFGIDNDRKNKDTFNRPQSIYLNKDVKIYKANYILNDTHIYNLFDTSIKQKGPLDKVKVINSNIFEHLKLNKEIIFTILGKGFIRDVCFV